MVWPVMPSAAGTHNTSISRSVTPAPQNRLVPVREKRLSWFFHSDTTARKKVTTIVRGLRLRPVFAGGSRGI